METATTTKLVLQNEAIVKDRSARHPKKIHGMWLWLKGKIPSFLLFSDFSGSSWPFAGVHPPVYDKPIVGKTGDCSHWGWSKGTTATAAALVCWNFGPDESTRIMFGSDLQLPGFGMMGFQIKIVSFVWKLGTPNSNILIESSIFPIWRLEMWDDVGIPAEKVNT